MHSFLLDYLLEVDKGKKIPRGLGLVNRKSNTNEVKASNFLFGERYAREVSCGIEHRKKLDILDLKDNRLEQEGLEEMLKRCPHGVKVLDLSYNKGLNMRKEGEMEVLSKLSS
jgi:hypothetical protein